MKKTTVIWLLLAAITAGACPLPANAAARKNMRLDTFDRTVSRITQATEKKEYQPGVSYLYDGLGGLFTGVYYLEGNSSYLSGGDYVETVPLYGNRRLHLHADTFHAGENRYIELYHAPEMALDDGYHFIYEMDILFADSVCGLEFAIKPGTWRNVAFRVPAGDRVLNAAGETAVLEQWQWHHIAIVLHRESAAFSCYLDGKALFEQKALIPVPEPAVKPSRFSAITMKVARGNAPSDVYVDNVRWYEQQIPYDASAAAAEITSDSYRISGGAVHGVPQIPVAEFLKRITVSEGAQAVVTEADGTTRVREEKPVRDGMTVMVTAADGLTVKRYGIYGAGNVRFYNADGTELHCLAESGTVTAKIDGDPGNLQRYLAVYDSGGALVGTGAFVDGACTISGIANPEDCRAAVFCWEGLQPQERPGVLSGSAHPFLLLNKEDIQPLQDKAVQSPWREIKANAVKQMRASIARTPVTEDSAYAARCNQISDVASAAALTYLLCPELREESKAILLDMIDLWDETVSGNLYTYLYPKFGDYFSRCVPPATTFTYCLLGLDIIHDDISRQQLERAETLLGRVAQRYLTTGEGHMVAVLGVRGLWGLYTGDEQVTDAAWDEWLSWYNGYMSADGVGSMGTEYATVRFVSNERMAKGILPLVMTHTGRADGFFDTGRHADFAEWAIGYTYAPGRQSWAIGDTSVRRRVNGSTQLAFRPSAYSKLAAGLRAFVFDNPTDGDLIHYLTAEPTEPVAPKSRIFKDGGAWFYEDMQSRTSLGGFLLNSTATDGHAHKETNAVSLAAYGEVLTVNAGYNKWNTGAGGYSWNYINQRAVSANTVLVDYTYDNLTDPPAANDHQSKSGAGLTEWLLTDPLCYARGSSGEALPNAVHDRSFWMVAPEGEVPGYFILADQVDAGKEMTVVHRPFSDRYTVASDGKEYQWTVNRDSGHDVGLAIYLAAKPTAAEVTDGVAAVWEDGIPLKPLLAKYPADKRALTVLYPYDGQHPKAVMTRIVGSAEGAVIKFGDTIDYLVQAGNFAKSGVEYTGDGIIVRRTGGAVRWLFAENATAVSCDGRQYFTSDKPVSVFADADSPHTLEMFAQQDTVVTVGAADDTAILIDGRQLLVWSDGAQSQSFFLPAGQHRITIG